MSANTETTGGPPKGYGQCSEKCGRWTNSGKCWTCCARLDGKADVYQSPDTPDWTPPIAAPAAHVERRKVDVGQRRKNHRDTFTVYAIEGDLAIVCQAGQVDFANGYVHKGGTDCCWESVSVLEDCELLADAPPEPAKSCETCGSTTHEQHGLGPKSPPAQEAQKAAPVCGNNGCKTPHQNVAQRWCASTDGHPAELEWSCEPCHLLDEKEFTMPTKHAPYAGPERLPKPQLAADWVEDCLPGGVAMKTPQEFLDSCQLAPGIWNGDVKSLIEQRDAEHRAELLKLQDDLLQAANREVMAEALIERLRGVLGEAKRVIAACAHVPCVLASMSRTPGAVPRSCGSCGTCSARRLLAAPPPAESTPVQVPIYGDGKRMDGPAATLALKNPAAINRTTPGTTTCELCMQNDADRPAAFQCDGCAEYSCIEHAAAHRCLTTPAAPPDDIRAFTPPLTTREWMMDHERRLAALEAKGEPGTHAKGEER